MILQDSILEAIRRAAEGIDHGSVEIKLDKNNPYVDIIKTERVRLISASDKHTRGDEEWVKRRL